MIVSAGRGIELIEQRGVDVRRFLFSGPGWPHLLVPFIAVAIVLELTRASAGLIFIASALGVIPTAALMSRATEGAGRALGPRHRRVPERHVRQRARG